MKLVGMKDDLVNGKEDSPCLIWSPIAQFFQRRNFLLAEDKKNFTYKLAALM